MREIKFRAWWREEMYSAVILDSRKTSVGLGYMGNPSWGIRFLELENVILLQYTGLKDKNGVEIYEGDRCNYGIHGWNLPYTSSGVVEWTDKGIRFYFSTQRPNLNFSPKEIYEIEVIGNIYENPELT